MREVPSTLTWQLEVPFQESPDAPVSSGAAPWLSELWEMRGRVLFDGGRRAAFQLGDGNFADPDPLDAYAYHALAQAPTGLVGCIRYLPLADAPTCGTELVLGRERFEKLLCELGTTRERTGEIGRWMVVPEHRGRNRLSFRLVAAAWAVGRRLGHHFGIATVGTRDGQDLALIRVGGRPAPGIEPTPAPIFDDAVSVVCFEAWGTTESMNVLIDEMGGLLSLDHVRLPDPVSGGGLEARCYP
jgi:hypothetical protein